MCCEEFWDGGGEAGEVGGCLIWAGPNGLWLSA